MARCRVCGSRSPLTASSLSVCAPCLRATLSDVSLHLARAQDRTRRPFGLPSEPPRDPRGILCDLCANQCRIPFGEIGYCGLRRNVGGRLVGGAPTQGNLSWYHDPLPTNCVADWVCPAGRVNARSACICYFDGDPSPQIPHSVATSLLARRRTRHRILRICWETNGTMHPRWLRKAMAIALASGGCIKFDGFHPQFYLHHLPITSREHAEEALAAAKAAGLTRM